MQYSQGPNLSLEERVRRKLILAGILPKLSNFGQGAMDSWHATFLGLRHLPREVTAFEIEAFYQFSAEECRVIEERRRPELKLALALQIGFLRMSGRLLEAGERQKVGGPNFTG